MAGLPVPAIRHGNCPNAMVDAALSALVLDSIRNARRRAWGARVCAFGPAIAPDSHTPTVPSTTLTQSATQSHGDSPVTDAHRSEADRDIRPVAYLRMAARKVTKPLDAGLSR